ncbi:MAG: hypothetical protein AAF456_05470 [Planctomycetota bacterium]
MAQPNVAGDGRMYRTGSFLALAAFLTSVLLSNSAIGQILDAESSRRARTPASSQGIMVSPTLEPQHRVAQLPQDREYQTRDFEAAPIQGLPWRHESVEPRSYPAPSAAEAYQQPAGSIYEATETPAPAASYPAARYPAARYPAERYPADIAPAQSGTVNIQQVEAPYYDPYASPQDEASSLDFELPDYRMSAPRSWPRKNIREISINMVESARTVPDDRSGSMVTQAGDDFTTFAPTRKVFAWAAPNIRYQPLYFEDVALERYGHEYNFGKQIWHSAWHMTRSTFYFPWNMYVENPFSCDTPYGFCRPGNCVPETFQQNYYQRCYDR